MRGLLQSRGNQHGKGNHLTLQLKENVNVKSSLRVSKKPEKLQDGDLRGRSFKMQNGERKSPVLQHSYNQFFSKCKSFWR